MKTYRKIFFALVFFSFVTAAPAVEAKLPSVKSDQKRDYLVWGKNYKIVWREEHYNVNLKGNVAQLVIDQKLISKAPRYLIALVALPVYYYNDKCSPAVRKRETFDQLMGNYFQCSLNSALGVGHQCSGAQISLLHQYFPDEPISKRACNVPYHWKQKLVSINVTQEDEDTFTVVNKGHFFGKDTIERITYDLVDGHFIEIP